MTTERKEEIRREVERENALSDLVDHDGCFMVEWDFGHRYWEKFDSAEELQARLDEHTAHIEAEIEARIREEESEEQLYRDLTTPSGGFTIAELLSS